MNHNLQNKSKRLAFLLRHDTEYLFEEHGWRNVCDLISNHGYSMDELLDIVVNNDKQRYEFNDDKSRIRARQGHSVKVDVELKEVTPPDVLYHGTATRFIDSIRKIGLVKGTRQHVHLSFTEDTALNVGSRHGEPVILTIIAKQMVADGIKFYLSNNGVWLTDFVDVKYIGGL